MATFTFRIPDSMVGRLNSADMRAWLSQYLRNPYSLPPDPGSGHGRISLTLPQESVRDLAGYLCCSASIALRRLAATRLGVTATAIAPWSDPRLDPVATGPSRPSQRARPASAAVSPKKSSDNNPGLTPPRHEGTGAGGIAILVSFLIVGALILLGASGNGSQSPA